MCWMCKTTATQVSVLICGSCWWSNTGGCGLCWPVPSPIWERCRVISEVRAFTRQGFFFYISVALIMRNGQETEPTAKCGLWTARRMKSHFFLSQSCVFGRGEIFNMWTRSLIQPAWGINSELSDWESVYYLETIWSPYVWKWYG
jgi:hypothetical protein